MDDNTYAVGWVTLALINSGLAQTKNRSGPFWFLISLFLGPVATFFVVIAVTAEPRPSRRRTQDQEPGQDMPAQGS